ncbi:MAG TPA: hypothetical protein VGR57_16120 [Ktedonobacterales bacterium]|nr:hypothetical protein [Ktedonobacterales bacterium]
MSSPTTKRDQRRMTRREQFQQRQEERRRARERARRIQQYRRLGIIGGTVIVVGLLSLLVARSIIGGSRPTTTTLQAATGQTVDNISCTTGEQLTVHYHADLQIYVNGQVQAIPAGVGIVLPDGTQSAHLTSNGQTACIYSLHTHDNSGIVHIESPDNRSYTLGNLFDIWGQHLSTTQFMGHAVDAKHKLAVVVYDATGAKKLVTGNPANVVLSAHDTIVIQYNSATELGSPYTQWGNL